MISTLLAEPTGPDRRATIRISRPPRHDPPFDDERDPGAARQSNPARQSSPAQPDGPASPPSMPERGTGASGAGRAAMVYVRLCIEVLNGYRTPGHLRRIAGPVEFADVIEQIRQRHNACGHFLAAGRALNERPGMAGAAKNPRNSTAPAYARPGLNRSGLTRPTFDAAAAPTFSLTRLCVSEPRAGVAEVVAVLSRSGTSLAVAIRLEHTGGAWICTVVQVV